MTTTRRGWIGVDFDGTLADDLPLVLFTGSRDWPDPNRVWEVVQRLHEVLGPYRAVEGGARGVDTFARLGVQMRGLACHTERPRYDLYPRWQAPKLRNTAMLMMKPVLVAAFWREGSQTGGTLDCIDKAVNVFRYPLLLYRK